MVLSAQARPMQSCAADGNQAATAERGTLTLDPKEDEVFYETLAYSGDMKSSEVKSVFPSVEL